MGSQPTNNYLHCNETRKFIPVFTRPRQGRPIVMHDFSARFAPSLWLKVPVLLQWFCPENCNCTVYRNTGKPPANDVTQNRIICTYRYAYSIYTRSSLTHKFYCNKNNPSKLQLKHCQYLRITRWRTVGWSSALRTECHWGFSLT